MPSPKDIFTLVLVFMRRADRLMVGPVIKQYGPFRLHSQASLLKNEQSFNLPACVVVVGDFATPLVLRFGAKRDDPNEYASVLKERHGPFHECVYVGDIPIKRSTDRDLYNHVDRWLNYKQTAIACYAEQLSGVERLIGRQSSTGEVLP